MAAKITATYDGDGSLQDPGHEGSPEGSIEPGVPFEVTKARFDELVAQGIPLSKVKPAAPAEAAEKPAAAAKENT